VPDIERKKFLKSKNFDETREFPEREALSDDEINEMKKHVDFQSHSRYHSIIPNCSCKDALEDLEESKKILEGKYKLSINSFSYPNSDYSIRETELLIKAGYKTGHTALFGYNNTKTNPYLLKRFCISDDSDMNQLIVQASGIWSFLRKLTGKKITEPEIYVNKNDNF